MYIIVRLFRHLDKKLSFYFMFFFFLVPFKIFAKSVDGWTSSVYSEEKNHTSCISLFKSVDMWTRSCFSISCFFSFLYPPKCFAKSETSGRALYILKKKIIPHVFHYSKVWTCGQEAVSLFHVFFLSCTLQNVLQKVWTGGQALKILNILMRTVCISIFKSVDMWTRSCLSISTFLSFLYPLKYLQKVWTHGQALNFLKK